MSPILQLIRRPLPHDPNRRFFLKLGALAAAAQMLPAPAGAAARKALGPVKSLSLFNLHTGERFDACYCIGGHYSAEALERISHLMRDHRTGEVLAIDRGLLDRLHDLSLRLRLREPFRLISGYRSPRTNAMLCRRTDGVASNSYHVLGKAADIAVRGRKLGELRDAALDLKVGGVGYYPKSGFIHVDVGPLRAW